MQGYLGGLSQDISASSYFLQDWERKLQISTWAVCQFSENENGMKEWQKIQYRESQAIYGKNISVTKLPQKRTGATTTKCDLAADKDMNTFYRMLIRITKKYTGYSK